MCIVMVSSEMIYQCAFIGYFSTDMQLENNLVNQTLF